MVIFCATFADPFPLLGDHRLFMHHILLHSSLDHLVGPAISGEGPRCCTFARGIAGGRTGPGGGAVQAGPAESDDHHKCGSQRWTFLRFLIRERLIGIIFPLKAWTFRKSHWSSTTIRRSPLRKCRNPTMTLICTEWAGAVVGNIHHFTHVISAIFKSQGLDVLESQAL
jgi:hypothetical protein